MTNHQSHIKVAYFLGALNRGGAESLILDICRQHQHVSYDFICVYRHEGNMSDDFRASGANLIQVWKGRGQLRYLWHIRQLILREQITIAHSQTGANTILLFFALLGLNIKIVTTFHGHMFADAPRWQRKVVYHASERILCVSNYQKQYYERKWNLPKQNKLQVVYNGIDFTKLDSEKIERIRELENKSVKLAMVGNFIKGRSQMVVVRALERLTHIDAMRLDFANLEPTALDASHLDFYFIGRRDDSEPERYDDCVKYCETLGLKNVHFMGSRNDVPSILKTIDGFVYSTEHDTFGIAVIEAIAAGLPVVVNDWPVMKEVCSLQFVSSRLMTWMIV